MDPLDPSVAASTPASAPAPKVADQTATARASGYSWDEINSHLSDKRDQAKSAGYTDEEINKYLGLPQPAAGKEYFSLTDIAKNSGRAFIDYPEGAYEGLKKDWEELNKDMPEPPPGFWPAVKQGIDKIGMAGNIPVDVFNTALSPLAATYGAVVSRPFSMGETNLIQLMLPKDASLSKEELDRHQNILEQSANIVPLLTGFKDAAFTLRAKTSPMITPAETTDAATAVTGLKGPDAVEHGIGNAATNLHDNWVKTGEPPIEAARRAQSDPIFRAQIQAPPPPEVQLGSSATETPNGPFVIDKLEGPPEPPAPPSGEPPAPPENPSPWEHVASRIADIKEGPGPWERMKDLGYRTYLELFNPDHPIRALVDAATDGKKLPDMEDPNYLYRFAELSNTRSQYMVERNMIDIDGNITGKGLNAILDPLKGKEKDFWTYSVARWAVEKADQVKETGVDVDAARKVIEEGGTKYGGAFAELVDWQNGTLKYAKDGGLVSAENYAKMVAGNKARIPGYRVDEEASEKVKGSGPGKTAYSPVKQFFGSDKKIEPILKSLLQEAFLRIELANRNRANLALADLAQETGLGEKIPNQPRPFELTEQELARLGEEAVVKGQEDASAATIFRAVGRNIGKDDIPIFRDGKMEVWNFKDPELTNVLRGYDNITRTTWQRIAGSLTNVTRNMIVLNPAFPIKLMSYDIPWQFITKPVLRNTIADTFVGLKHIVGDSPQYDEWMRSGGAERIFQGLTKNDYIKDILKGHEDPAYLDGVWNAVRSPYDALRAWAQTLNQAQRVGRYARGIEQGESRTTAAAASTDAAFHRAGFGGAAAKSWNSIAPFTSAYLNSLEQTFRGMTGIGKTITGDAMNAAAFSAKAVAVVTIPLVANWYFNHDKAWYQAAPDWQKDNGLLIHVGPDDGGHTIFIKYPPLISLIYGTIPRRMMEQFANDNPQAWAGFGKSLGASFAPPGGLLTYNVFLPVLEQLSNHSFFRDQPLVPDDLKRNVLTPEQYNPYSSGTAKGLSRFMNDMPLLRNFGLSPPVVDNYIADWGGTIGSAAVKSADMALGTGPRAGNAPATKIEDMPLINSFLSRYPSATAQPIRDFEARIDNYNAVHGSLMRAMEAGDLDRFNQIVKENPAAAAMHRFQFTQSVNAKIPQGQDMAPYMATLQKASKQINNDDASRVLNAEKALKNMKDYAQLLNSNKKLTPVDKRQMLDQTYGWMQEISQRGVGSMNRSGMP